MKRIALIGWLLMVVISAHAMDGNEVRYVSGTSTTIKPDAVGRVDLGLAQSLVFERDRKSVV